MAGPTGREENAHGDRRRAGGQAGHAHAHAHGPNGECLGNAPAPPHRPRTEPKASWFAWPVLPWWLIIIVLAYGLIRLQMLVESPCATLGIAEPLSRRKVRRALRTLSMCTHPDRFVGQPEKQRRGEVLFARIGKARDELMKRRPLSCMVGSEIEREIMEYLALSVSETSFNDVAGGVQSLFWGTVQFARDVVTLQYSFSENLAWIFLSMFLYRIVKGFLQYLWTKGALGVLGGVLSGIVLGPWPTLFRLLVAPFYRWRCFVSVDVPLWLTRIGMLADSKAQKEDDGNEEDEEDTTAEEDTTVASTSVGHAVSAHETLPAHMRRRKKMSKKKLSTTERKKKNEDVLLGVDKVSQQQRQRDEEDEAGDPLPDRLWGIVSMSSRTPWIERSRAMGAIQFNYFLILTKPIIPLVMLVMTGEVYNGIYASMMIGFMIRKVPQMHYDTMHALTLLFGALHTVLGVSAQHIANVAEANGQLVMQWEPSFRDVLVVLSMMQLGSIFTAASRMGNEPSLTLSFASGVALRVMMHDLFTSRGVVLPGQAELEQGLLSNFNVVVNTLDSVATRAADGVGTCGGGPFRVFFSAEYAMSAALIFKCFMALLPTLYCAQWGLRLLQVLRPGKQDRGALRVGIKRNRRRRLLTHSVLFFCSMVQCCLLWSFDFNALNGSLTLFWCLLLIGSAFESLLSTYDIRGAMRQFINYIIFIFV